jgi:hypothetical protein
VPVGNISASWLNAARARVCSTYGVPCDIEESKPRVRSTIRLIRDSERYFDKQEIRPETFSDIVKYMGGKDVLGEASGTTHISYAHNHFGQNIDIPHILEKKIAQLLPGLIAQESQFNDRALSPVGARGMMQIMPDTQRRMGYGTTPLTFQKQIELSGKYFENAYKELSAKNNDDFTHITNEFFAGDTESFDTFFLAPVLINTYNSGTGRLSRVITWFRDKYPTRESISEISSGSKGYKYDVYAAMAHFASENTTTETSGYKEHSSEYFSRVFALANIVEKKPRSKTIGK